MLESVLVADRGLGAARVLATCRRLGIKSVLAGLSDDVYATEGPGAADPNDTDPNDTDPNDTDANDADARDDADASDDIPTDARHLADDVVLLSGVAELIDPTAVVRAAVAAGVQAIHPGYGPLRGDARLARSASDAGLIAIVTAGVGLAEENARTLAGSVPAVPTVAAGSSVARWVYVLGVPTGVVVLGSVRVVDGHLIAAAPTATESAGVAADHRLAHAASAVLGLTGLAAVGIGAVGTGVVGIGKVGTGAVGIGAVGTGAVGTGAVGIGKVGVGRGGAEGVGWGGVAAVVAGLPDTHAAWELVADVDLVELQLLAATGGSIPTARSEFPLSGVAIGRAAPAIVDDIRALDAVAQAGLRIDAVALAGSTHAALVRVSAWGADLALAQRALSSPPFGF